MSAEQVYERIVTDLERRYDSVLREAAYAAFREAGKAGYADDRDARRDYAVDALEKIMFDSFDFQTVKATDITDIACEIADEEETADWMSGGN